MLPDLNYSREFFSRYGLELTDELYEKLCIYSRFLTEYNKKVNLTAITEPEDILIKHFIDSIIVLKYVDFPENSTIIDVGTGAGFPSVPMKLYRPDLRITLLDSLNKRIEFLKQLCDRLNIYAEFIHGRAEDISKDIAFREKFDFSCARAVANMSVLSELCIPFVNINGSFISLKGPNENIDSAAGAIKVLGGEINKIIEYELDGDKRMLVDVKKISQTPTKYPRNSSRIKKNPL